ncbi:MAG: potassium transporter TrkG [Acidimicrobiales bacterium]
MRSDDRRIRHPAAFVIGWFGALIALGTLLLALPISHSKPDDVGVGDALFTAASAVTVTGLGVVDTGEAWSGFGETIVLLLVQVGGLGIMTLASFLGIAINRRLRVRSGLLAGAEIGLSDYGVLRHLIRDLVVFVALTESVVSVLLTVRFAVRGEYSWLGSLHQGVFHSISAFNNAGFSITEGGLERYVGDWYVSLVVAATLIIGGIGFPVVFEIRNKWRHPTSWSLHTKVTLSVSAMLLLAGTLLIAMIEWSNEATLGLLSPEDRMLASFFQSATARTAGFNTVPIGSMRDASWLVLILLMVIGGGSGSTAGGIKTSTFALVIKSTLAEFRSDPSTTLFDRAIPLALQRQALALVIAALGTVGTGAFILEALEPQISAEELLFEAASAFGTVGLSTGVTTDLGWLSELVVVTLMFVGRVGPITFGTAVLLRPQQRRYNYAEEQLMVG